MAFHQHNDYEKINGDDDDVSSNEFENTNSYKISAMIILSSVSIIMGITPIFVSRLLSTNKSSRYSKVVGVLLGFGGGVLFSTTFLHLLPEVRHLFDEEIEEHNLGIHGLPPTESVVCLGFFIMYLVEELVRTLIRRQQSKVSKVTKTDVNRSTNELVENGQVSVSMNGHSHGYNHDHDHSHHGHSHHGHSHIPVVMLNNQDNPLIASLKGLLIVLGLSVHELFEGLAIGLMKKQSSVLTMTLAVAVHKFVIAFCIGVQLTATQTNRWLSIIYVCTFAIVSPIGIGIGLIMVGGDPNASTHPSITALFLQAIATGTLLYVVFFEILQHHREGIRQYLSIIIGFLALAVLQKFTAHSHSHDDNHHDSLAKTNSSMLLN